MKLEIISNSPEETEEIAQKIGAKLKGGECIEFVSDLGGGKTTFTRGLLAGIGSEDQVSSPTFMISQKYGAGDLCVYHYDFYRLSEPGLILEELAEIINAKNNIVVVEWAETVKAVLPETRLKIIIDRVTDAENGRNITLQSPESIKYLVEDVK